MLVSIHAYWAQIMLLPKSILKGIIRVCRAFLWKGKEESTSPGAVAWDQLCKAKSEGGLGIRNIEKWNIAVVFKHFWAVAKKKKRQYVGQVDTSHVC